MQFKLKSRPLVLAILDGWGYREDSTHNAIEQAQALHWKWWWQTQPHLLLSCSGTAVGLPEGQMGNSEVGHMHVSAGRIILQDLTRIDNAIADGSFQKNPVFLKAFKLAKEKNVAIHVIGLLSPGGVHSQEQHLFELVKMADENDVPGLWIHALLDGRDTPPKSAKSSVMVLEAMCQASRHCKIASISGRYYAMDRDQRWDRTKVFYDLLTEGEAPRIAKDAISALETAYQNGETDEFVKPTSIEKTVIQDGDIVLFFNFRADRMRQIVRALLIDDFTGFMREKRPRLTECITMTEYAKDIPSIVAFPQMNLLNSFGEYISKLGLKQLRIAETEKYAHVTFFFNGGQETVYPGEDRILIPSPKVNTYDLEPEMSANQLTEKLMEAIHSEKYDVIICNFANADMVGHTGDFTATVRAIDCLDKCLSNIADALQQVGGEMVITADHGNAECMYDEKTHQPHTAHTTLPVPFLYLGRPATVTVSHGSLIDIAPTLLYLMGIKKPVEMTGQVLLKLSE